MNNNLIVNATQQGSRIALVKDKNLVEFHYEEESRRFKVGDIYLGIVKKVVPGLNAAFIDIGFDKDALATKETTEVKTQIISETAMFYTFSTIAQTLAGAYNQTTN